MLRTDTSVWASERADAMKAEKPSAAFRRAEGEAGDDAPEETT
jgi:hypothetical protein